MNIHIKTLSAALAVAAIASFVTTSSASACNVVGYTKSGERLCSTTHVYKNAKAKKWDDPSQYSNKGEKCRSACLRDAMKLSSGNVQATFFTMCKRKNGCT